MKIGIIYKDQAARVRSAEADGIREVIECDAWYINGQATHSGGYYAFYQRVPNPDYKGEDGKPDEAGNKPTMHRGFRNIAVDQVADFELLSDDAEPSPLADFWRGSPVAEYYNWPPKEV